ncbi:probable serine/threonine-protein kinase DDB_G0278845 isoform X2 [Polistes fuscatus]|uniref:probable serine/threonine-protein kinase DDB_G0278845 isoform X2 n=1 Tax=Polistes fuscatus TaxID=30207 RepID=UPI001CA9E364|nr:probable serine/threonine-protein kinase DDB_G0278845 isoform X2 [Polistes fuscatus]
MFGEGAMWDDYGNNNGDKSKEEQPERLVIDVDIPMLKVEPLSPTASDSYESPQSPLSLPIVTPVKLKDPIILLEKCDKIWKTLQLIKNVQSNGSENMITSTMSSSLKDPHIIYQPILGNNNSALPNFKFSVKSTKKLYHCNVCGKEYSENRTLRSHSQRVHGIYIPPKRIRSKPKPKEICSENITSDLTTKITSIKVNENNSPIEKKTNVLDKDMTQTKYDSYRGKCPLCKRSITSLRKHLTEYHKIGCPGLVIKELESNAIESSNLNLQNLTKAMINTITSSENSENDNKMMLELVNPNEVKSNENETSNVENDSQNLQSKKMSRFLCDICYGVYASSSFSKHRRIHRKRGETKDNFDVFNCRYINSPLNNKRTLMSTALQNQEKSKMVLLDSMKNDNLQNPKSNTNNKNNNNNNNNKRRRRRRRRVSKNNLNRSCICGRTFRNYHTLILHKNSCKLKDNSETDSITEDNPDRDSSSGINIKIKKKNDSYEIVSKDSSDENKPKDSGHPHNHDTLSNISELIMEGGIKISQKNHSLDVLESFKYSKEHSILKIETINENIDINIEENSRDFLVNDREENKQIDEEEIHISEIQEGKGNVEVVPTYLCEAIMSEQSETADDSNILKAKKRSTNANNTDDPIKPKKPNLTNTTKNINILKRRKENQMKYSNQKLLSNTPSHVNTICPCGELFPTVNSCNAHITKCHPLFLRCGFCTERFSTIGEYNNHRCNVEEGKMFTELQIDMSCPFCHIIVKNKNEFDQHIKFQHFDPELPYQCHECTKKFPSSTGCQLHFQRAHGKCLCNVCGKKLTAATKIRHEGYHYGLGFPCHICKKTHSTRKHLSSHIKNIHGDTESLVTCNICLKKVKKKSYSWHLYAHKTITWCKLCKKVYCDARTLEHHIISSHKGKYPWIKCNFCTRKFCNRRFLETHIRREKCNRDYLQIRRKNKKNPKDHHLLHS